jgi:hypothetical protein
VATQRVGELTQLVTDLALESLPASVVVRLVGQGLLDLPGQPEGLGDVPLLRQFDLVERDGDQAGLAEALQSLDRAESGVGRAGDLSTEFSAAPSAR